MLAGAGDGVEQSYGYLVIAVKPDLLVDLADYRPALSESIHQIKATPRQPDVDEIRIPSDRACRERARNLRERILVDRHIYDSLLPLPADRLPLTGWNQ